MTLPVPLTVRIGDRHVTREVAGLGFRREAVGGLKSIQLRLSRPIGQHDTLLQPYREVAIFDGRTAETIASGRLTDTGRHAGADGQAWDLVAFGPAQHASDREVPLVYVDRRLSTWVRSVTADSASTTQQGGKDGAGAVDALRLQVPEGAPNETILVAMATTTLQSAGLKIGAAACEWRSGVTTADHEVGLRCLAEDAEFLVTVAEVEATANTTGGSLSLFVGRPDWSDTFDVALVQFSRPALGTIDDTTWADFDDVRVLQLRMDKAGVEHTTQADMVTADYVLAHWVIEDLLGRVLDQFDGASAVVDDGAAFQIQQLAYEDGATPAKVLEDLMALEPAYRWTAGPANAAGKYTFRWEPWPTTVRYEVTLDDGGDFPSSAQELYNRVAVRWVDTRGRVRTTRRTLACQILDDAGIVREKRLDLGEEAGSLTAAERIGDNFLAEHNVPRNAGQLSVSRPIVDMISGRLVQPWEIEPGELIRVRGVESYPDALNASSNDGRTVFRIHAVDYGSDDNTARLELDSDARTTANALARLSTRRPRRR